MTLVAALGLSACSEEAAPSTSGPGKLNFGDIRQGESDGLVFDTSSQDVAKTDAGKSDVAVVDVVADSGSSDAAADGVVQDGTVKDSATADVGQDAKADVGSDASADVAKDTAVDVGKDISNCTPKAETCNELDDDCDGETDESCDDGEACTENDSCNFTSCYGTFKKCNDDDKCTADTCAAGSCVFKPYTCKDNEPCTTDTCDPASGCKYIGTTEACDDGNSCTSGDSCATGSCQGTAIACDDGNPCTTDSCDKTAGCKSVPNTAACDDNNGCTATDVCQNGSCVGSGGVCDDGNSCTTDTCDGGSCGHESLTGTGCDDGNACTSGDACDNGTCIAAPVSCDDGLACTNDSCSNGQCVFQDNCQAGYKCDSASNQCILAGCALPTNACANGSQDRKGCGKARVIGRKAAMSGWKESWGNTCSYYTNSSNLDNCSDGGNDDLYRIFLRKGEQLTLKYTAFFCPDDYANGKLTVSAATSGCGEPTKSSCSKVALLCETDSSSDKSFTAPAEGWYYIAADADWSGEGADYSLSVTLNASTCQVAGCECP